MSLKVKIIQDVDWKVVEKLVNDFSVSNNVRASQSHVTKDGDFLVYTFVLFYEELRL